MMGPVQLREIDAVLLYQVRVVSDGSCTVV